MDRVPETPPGHQIVIETDAGAKTLELLAIEKGRYLFRASMGQPTNLRALDLEAAAFGGSPRDVDVVSPGGTQRVEWRNDGLFLTGWAQVLLTGTWQA